VFSSRANRDLPAVVLHLRLVAQDENPSRAFSAALVQITDRGELEDGSIIGHFLVCVSRKYLYLFVRSKYDDSCGFLT
jgi:hypothetical protein